MNPTWYNTCTSLHIYSYVHLYIYIYIWIMTSFPMKYLLYIYNVHIYIYHAHVNMQQNTFSSLSSLEVLNMRPPALMVWRCVVLLNALTVRSARGCLRYRIPENKWILPGGFLMLAYRFRKTTYHVCKQKNIIYMWSICWGLILCFSVLYLLGAMCREGNEPKLSEG